MNKRKMLVTLAGMGLAGALSATGHLDTTASTTLLGLCAAFVSGNVLEHLAKNYKNKVKAGERDDA